MPSVCTLYPCLYLYASTLFDKPNDYVYDSQLLNPSTPNTATTGYKESSMQLGGQARPP